MQFSGFKCGAVWYSMVEVDTVSCIGFSVLKFSAVLCNLVKCSLGAVWCNFVQCVVLWCINAVLCSLGLFVVVGGSVVHCDIVVKCG